MKQIFTKFLALMIAVFTANFVQAQCPGGQSEISITIVEDNYGSETSWELTDGTNTLLSGGPYVDGNNGTSHTETVCVPHGTQLTFIIEDGYGDGICCAYGNGSYTVKMNGCNTVASGAEFTDSETSNFTVVAQPNVDLAVTSFDIDPIIVMGSTPIQGTIANLGSSGVQSFDLNYSIDNGATVTQTINSTIGSCATYDYDHGTEWNANASGTYSVKVWVSNVTGGDQDDTNDEMTKEVSVATQSVPSLPLFEEFTSSTCGPCAAFNVDFDPYLTSVNTNIPGGDVAAVKYQMNWPSPGNDPSYNPDGNTRRGFYGVSGIPDLFLNGMPSGGSSQEVSAAKAKPSFVNIQLSYALNFQNEVDVTAVVTPYADLPGNIKLFIAVTEDYYEYTASTTSQDDFHFVERKMLPNANGNTLSNVTAGTPITVNKAYSFTVGGPAQGNYNLWESIDDITVVAFVQNMDTKVVYQAAIANTPATIGIDESAAAIGLQVYPNPFSNQTNVYYTVEGMEDVNVRVYNLTGQEVYANDFGLQTAGQHNFQINGENFAAGMYVMNLNIGNKTVSHKLSVTK